MVREDELDAGIDNGITEIEGVTSIKSPEVLDQLTRIPNTLGVTSMSEKESDALTRIPPVRTGLAATPEAQGESSMFNFSIDDITKYISNLFSSPSPSPPKKPVEKKEQDLTDPAYRQRIAEKEISKAFSTVPKPSLEDIGPVGIPEELLSRRPARFSAKYSSNNPGNVSKLHNTTGTREIRAGEHSTGGYGKNKRFSNFDHPVMGLRAIFMDLNKKKKREYEGEKRKGSIDKMIAQYAPKNENETKKYIEFVKSKVGKDYIENSKDVRKAVEAIVEFENKEIEDGKLVDFYLSKKHNFMAEAEALSKLDLPEGTSYTEISEGTYNLKKAATGGRVTSNPNPYEPRAI